MLMTLQCKAILLITGNSKLLSNDLCFVAHVNIFKCTPQGIMHHTIDDLAVAHAVSSASFGQEIGSIAHTLHATGNDNLGVTQLDGLGRQCHRLETAATHFVNRHRRNINRQPGIDRCLASRILPKASLQHIAHDHLFHLTGFEVGPLQGRPNTNFA